MTRFSTHLLIVGVALLVAVSLAASPAPASVHSPAPSGHRAPAPSALPRRVGRPVPSPVPKPAPAAARFAAPPSPIPTPALHPPLQAIDEGYVQRHYPAGSSPAYRALSAAFEGESPLMEMLRSSNAYSWEDVLWLYDWHTPCGRVARHGARFVAEEGYAYTHASEVLPGLWIGSACAAADPLWLADRQIGLVVNAASEHGHTLLPTAWRDRVDYHKVQLEDRWVYTARQFLDDLDTAVAVLDAWRQAHPGGAVLVHCNLGISRSTSVVLRYLQRTHGLSVGEALALVQRARPFARPNRKFQDALGLPLAGHTDLKRRVA